MARSTRRACSPADGASEPARAAPSPARPSPARPPRMNLLERAERVLPGAVNSPVRAFRGVGREPVFVPPAQGAWLLAGAGRLYIPSTGTNVPHVPFPRNPAG